MPGKKKITLKYEEDFEHLLFGISSSEKDYRLIWLINEKLGMTFSKTASHTLLSTKEGKVQEFSSFIFRDDIRSLSYRIISNRSEEGLLAEELKNIDFFLIISGEYDEGFPSLIRNRFAGVEHIQAVITIPLSGLKSRERLILS